MHIFTGIEKVKVNPDSALQKYLVFEKYPYSHSLIFTNFAALAIGLALALILVSPAAPGKGAANITQKSIFDIFFRNDFVYWATITYFGSMVQEEWAGLPKGFALTPEDKVEVRALLASLLPVSERANGSFFDTYVSTPEMLNSSESKDYSFGNIKAPMLVISAVDDPLALHENARALTDRIPGARLLSILDGGHLLIGHHEEVKSEVTRFLQSNVTMLKSNEEAT